MEDHSDEGQQTNMFTMERKTVIQNAQKEFEMQNVRGKTHMTFFYTDIYLIHWLSGLLRILAVNLFIIIHGEIILAQGFLIEHFLFSTSIIYLRHPETFSSPFQLHLEGFLFTFMATFGPRLFFLAARLVRDEDTYGEVPALRAVLVLHQDAVPATVGRVHASDEEVGELARLELEDDVPVCCDLFVVLQPGDLWHGVTRNVAGETESLG